MTEEQHENRKRLFRRVITAFFVLLLCEILHARTTTEPKAFLIGDRYTSNWRTSGFVGSATRTWNATGTSFGFNWSTRKGNQIGRIGKAFYSPGFNVRADDIRDKCIMSTTASMTNLTSSTTKWYIWSIYGWTHSQNVKWPKLNGWNNEFYVVFKTTVNTGPGSGYVSIGNVTIDGTVFDCYTHDMPWGTTNQTQWMAVSRDPSWSASVDLKKIFAYWRSKGLPNEYVVDLTWALEGGAGSSGKLSLSDVNIPALVHSNTPPSVVPQKPAAAKDKTKR